MTTKPETTDAVIALLAGTWPRCFAIYERRRKPLKVGIHLDILPALEGTLTLQDLGPALRRYTTNSGYLAAMKPGAARIDLEGRPAGAVTAEEAAGAAAGLAARKEKRRQPQASTPAPIAAPAAPPAPAAHAAPPAPPTPKRLGLDDLRGAARLRRKAQEGAAA
jgi:ProP effector